jgi:hypothetical protein
LFFTLLVGGRARGVKATFGVEVVGEALAGPVPPTCLARPVVAVVVVPPSLVCPEGCPGALVGVFPWLVVVEPVLVGGLAAGLVVVVMVGVAGWMLI